MKTGIDIAKIDRFEKINKKFIRRCFTDKEIKELEKKKFKIENIASVFSSKEAFSKAYGLGIFEFGFQNISVLHDEFGKPFLEFSKEGERKLLERGLAYSDISISHDGGMVVSVVLLRKEKPKKFNLKKRYEDTNKGDYGRIGIIGGSRGMAGANYLSSTAALKSGAGLVYSICPSSIEKILQIKFAEIIVKGLKNSKDYFDNCSLEEVLPFIKKLDALALGPGLGTNKSTGEFVKNILKQYNGPLVLDADGINLVDIPFLKSLNKDFILTPHPKELSRLIGASVDEIQSDRKKFALETANKTGKTILLKGHGTIVASPKGQIYINKTGNPGMATPGSGDVLTGIIACLLGQGYKPFEGGKLGAYFHGLAGDYTEEKKGQASMIASDLIDSLSEVLR